MSAAKITLQAAEDLDTLAGWVADEIAACGGAGTAYGDVSTFMHVPDAGHPFMTTAGVYHRDGTRVVVVTGLGETLAAAVADARGQIEARERVAA